MRAIQGYHLIKPEDLHWRPSNLMKIPNADYLERTGSENLGARLWRLPAKSANTLHKHIRSEEFYFVLEGTGRMRVGDEALRYRNTEPYWLDRTIRARCAHRLAYASARSDVDRHRRYRVGAARGR